MKLIKVSVIIFPNGETLWIKDLKKKKLQSILKRWKEFYAKKHKEVGISTACATIFMPEDDYNNIPATNKSYELTKE